MKQAKIGNIESFETRIKQLKDAHRHKQLKQAKEFEAIAAKPISKAEAKKQWCDTVEEYREYCLNRAKQLRESANKCYIPIKYYPRLKYFKNSTDSLGFDPATGEGHSYNWYTLTKVINKKMVVNSYGYSMQTCKHRNEVGSLLRTMGIDYVEIEAPQGLQDLNAAYAHIVKSLGKAMIADKYAKTSNHRYNIRHYLKQLQTLKSIGYKFKQSQMDQAIEAMFNADTQSRLEAKERGKQLRAQRRALMPKVTSTEAVSLLTA